MKGGYVFVILGWEAFIPVGFKMLKLERGIEGERVWMSLIECIACGWDLHTNTEDGRFQTYNYLADSFRNSRVQFVGSIAIFREIWTLWQFDFEFSLSSSCHFQV